MDKKIKSFEDLEIWQESTALAVNIYNLLKDCKNYGFRDQIQRASVSVRQILLKVLSVTPTKNTFNICTLPKDRAGNSGLNYL